MLQGDGYEEGGDEHSSYQPIVQHAGEQTGSSRGLPALSAHHLSIGKTEGAGQDQTQVTGVVD